VFFYGMREQDEIAVELEKGKTLAIRLMGQAVSDEDEEHRLFFELNGQARTIRVPRSGSGGGRNKSNLAEDGNPLHVGAPMQGSISSVAVKVGQHIKAGDPLVLIEAMKMETM